MQRKNVLVIGSGGREHALAAKLRESSNVGELYVAPGNGGTSLIAKNIPIFPTNFSTLIDFAMVNDIHLTVVGPDDPLALGIVDAFQDRGLRVFGPKAAAAQIESSKVFAKCLMQNAGIPTAPFQSFRKHDEALAHVQEHGAPIVVKASGLALGKGARVCMTLEEAEQALEEIMIDRIHGDAGDEVVVEEYLPGPEVSVHVVSDGHTCRMFPFAQDHKPALDGDKGDNTGGMGAIAPVPWVTEELIKQIGTSIVRPTIDALAKHGWPFSGLLYPGLKIMPDGPMVLEYNARFGDPETQVYTRLLETDLLDILDACVDGTLSDLEITWREGFAACVVLASGGYPGEYKKGCLIHGIEQAERIAGVTVFHAGTRQDQAGRVFTSGGRVLGVTAVGTTLEYALIRAYQAVDCISFDGMQYRRDIGQKSLAMTTA